MRAVTWIVMIFLLSACSSSGQSSTQLACNFIQRQHVQITGNQSCAPKNPKHIALFINQDQPIIPYRVIGVATVARHNLIGLNRGDATIHEMMKNLAASIGGDGLMNISKSDDGMQATIIQYQKILI